MRRILPTFAAVGITALLLTSCAGGTAPAPASTDDVAAPTTAPSAAEPTAAPSPTVTAGALTCESLISSELLAQFDAQGWTAKQSPLSAGGVTLTEGLQCMWGDYTVGSGNVMIFGWAPITADEATRMQRGLESEGWLREEEGGALYITEDPERSPTIDVNGYGMTYQFGDGWVMVADLKQNLLLIQRPAL